jgi:hypothetical protein
LLFDDDDERSERNEAPSMLPDEQKNPRADAKPQALAAAPGSEMTQVPARPVSFSALYPVLEARM